MSYYHNSKSSRRAWERNFGPIPKGMEVDHRNRDSRVNEPGNLRLATRTQQNWNRGAFKNNRSGHKGVIMDRINHRWQVRVFAGPIRVYANAAHSISAIVASRLIRRTIHGEFAA